MYCQRSSRNIHLFQNLVQSLEFNSSELRLTYRNLKDELCEKFPTVLQVSAVLLYIAGKTSSTNVVVNGDRIQMALVILKASS